jgi:hypothetical protein
MQTTLSLKRRKIVKFFSNNAIKRKNYLTVNIAARVHHAILSIKMHLAP